MSLEIRRNKEQDTRDGDSLLNEVGQSASIPSTHRETFTHQSNNLIHELTRCLNEGVVIGPIIQGLTPVFNLPKTFRFADARAFNAESAMGTSSYIEALKAEISTKVQGVVNKALDLYDTDEGREGYLKRIQQEFDLMLKNLIEEERKGCANRVNALCGRIDSVVHNLEEEFRGVFDGNVESLRRVSGSLRRYVECHLQANTESSCIIEVLSLKSGGPVTLVSVEKFFENLSGEIGDLLFGLSERNVA